MQTCVAYSAVQANGATEAELTAILDATMPITNNHFLFPKNLNLLYALGLGSNLGILKIEQPSLRQVTPPYLWPFNVAAAVPNDPAIADYRSSPLRLAMQEELVVKATNTDGAATHRATCVLFLEDGTDPVPQGQQIYTVSATATITAGVMAWTSGNLTFGSQLPSGQYTVVNMMVQSATIIAARLIYSGGTNWRPGVVGVNSLSNRPPFQGRKDMRSNYGTFLNTVPPQLEILCTAADSAQQVFLDLVKVA